MKRAKRNANKHLENPFKFLAQGLVTDLEGEIYEEQVVPMEEFIESKKFLNLKWNGRRGCRPKIKEILCELDNPKIRQALLLLGKGCLSGDTNIWTDKGNKKISSLEGKIVNVQSHDKNDNLVWNKGLVVNRGVKQTKRYSFSNGLYIDATENHVLEVVGKGDIEISKMEIGDFVRSPILLLSNNVSSVDSEAVYARILGMLIGEESHKIVNNFHWISLVSVEDSDKTDVYDIICENPNHNYVANGIYVHNSGKDFAASVLQLRGIYKALCMNSPQSYYGLSTQSPIYFTNVARNEEQAKNVFFREFLGMLKECPWFDGKYSEPMARFVEFDKNIFAMSGNSQAFAWLGYNTIQWVGDEIAFFLEKDADDESESRAEECWQAAYGSCQTRFPNHYLMVGITTPRYDDDFVMKKAKELEQRMLDGGDGYFKQAATWDVNPNLTIEDFKAELARDYRRTMRDFGAQPMGVIESFWGDPEFIGDNVCEACRKCPVYHERKTNDNLYACWEYDKCDANAYEGDGVWREWFKPDPSLNYYMHFDLAISKDRIGFCIGAVVDVVRIERESLQKKLDEDKKNSSVFAVGEPDKYSDKPIIKIFGVGWVSMSRDNMVYHRTLIKNGEFSYSAILNKLILDLKEKGFRITKITTDQFQSHFFRQTLDDSGIITELISTDRTDEIPVQAKRAFVENRVVYPWSKMLYTEARMLQYVRGKKVDHPAKGSKDLWDSVAGVIYTCELEDFSGGTVVISEQFGEDD